MGNKEATKPPEPSSAAPPPQPPDPVEAAATDLAAIAQRMSRMQNKLLMDMSALMAETSSIKGAVAVLQQQMIPESFEKLHTTFAMLARNVATSQVKVDEGHLETRRLFSTHFEGLLQRLSGDMLGSVVTQFVLAAIAGIIDDTDAVLGAATSDDRSLPAYNAIRLLRQKLLVNLQAFGVHLLDVRPGETVFDEQLHECASVSQESEVPDGTILDVDRHGFIVNGLVVRRATVVVKGAR
jgi:hypothetical protein